MPRVKRSCIENIRQRVSLVDVAGAYTQLKRAGAQYRGLSPFSHEKTPSFYVHPDKNVFTCYSSGNAGDLFRFVELKENLTFNEAVETLARRYNIPLEYEDDGSPPEQLSLRKELLNLHEWIGNYYHQVFLSSGATGNFAREYWTEKRRFPLQLAQDFQIGFAPTQENHLIEKICRQSFSLEAIRSSGLFYLRDNETNPRNARPRFRGRLMIPIRDVQGRIVAFTARQTDLTPKDDPTHDAKYVNSPETPIFRKGDILFNLDRARQSVEDHPHLVMVEGQLDCLRCWDAGIKNAIAPQGTAVTEHQLTLVRRYTNKLLCVLDGDRAGQKAALRLLPIALKSGLEVNFIVLPEGADPDELLLNRRDFWEKLITHPLSPIAFAIRALYPGEKGSPRDKAEALQSIFQILSACDSVVAREAYLEELVRETRIEHHILTTDFQRFLERQASGAPMEPMASLSADPSTSNGKLTTVEYQLLFILLNHAELAFKIAEVLNLEWINPETLEGRLLRRILAEFREGHELDTHDLDDLLENDEEKNYIYRILAEKFFYENPIREANRCLSKIFVNYLDQRKKEIEVALLNHSNNSPVSLQELYRQRIELRRLRRNPPQLV